MKKFRWFAAILCAAVLALASFALFGCGEEKGKVTLLEKSEKFVVIEANETSGSLYDGLTYLKENGELDFESTGSGEMLFLTSVNGYAADGAKNEFWGIYTSLTELDGVTYSTAEFGTYTYSGTAYYSASYGCTGLPLVEGEVYILAISTF